MKAIFPRSIPYRLEVIEKTEKAEKEILEFLNSFSS